MWVNFDYYFNFVINRKLMSAFDFETNDLLGERTSEGLRDGGGGERVWAGKRMGREGEEKQRRII